ncbi:hypothetical protein KBC75_01205 [Candidatus Shapirobacteria bacterium]|nr:hypothetical protein [Candidatus Shapirobacteria bacterium]
MIKNIINPNSGIYLNYDYLMLPVSLNIISKIKISNQMFYSKNGYHVSLLCLEKYSKSDQQKILNIANKYPIKINKILKIYRLAQLDNQKSIIVRVKVTGLKKLLSELNTQYSYHFLYPPTHTTLFTLRNQTGIAINSKQEFLNLTYSINQTDSQKLAKSFKNILHL